MGLLFQNSIKLNLNYFSLCTRHDEEWIYDFDHIFFNAPPSYLVDNSIFNFFFLLLAIPLLTLIFSLTLTQFQSFIISLTSLIHLKKKPLAS